MFEEGQLYSPVTEEADGTVTVHLAPNHPGVNDPAYLERRGDIAKAAMHWVEGTPPPSTPCPSCPASTAPPASGAAATSPRPRCSGSRARPPRPSTTPSPSTRCG